MAIKIDIVLPRGRHSWNLGEGWVEGLRQKEMLGRVFHLDKDSEAHVMEFAPKEEADMILLMGGDHHLEMLHDTAEKRDAWRQSRMPRVAICYESIIDSRFPRSLEKSGQAVEAFTHFAHCDEKDAAFFESSQVPAFWMPQCVDHRRFCPGNGPRKPQVFFRGKNERTLRYDLRPQLIEKLRNCPDFTYIQEEMSDEELMRAYAEYACAINLPGVFGGYNVRTFEALASGSVLFQQRVPDRPRNEALFDDTQLISYAPEDPEGVVKKITEVTHNLGDYRKLAERGREACLAAHTIDHRIQEIITFVDQTYRSAQRLHIGCGKNILPNYINIDAIPHDTRILVQEAATLPDVAEGQFESIYACHVLEHFAYGQVQSVVEAWAKKLRPGGKLYLAVPDAHFLSLAYVLGVPLPRILPPLFGGQEYPTNFHYVGFDRKSLTAILRKAGFAYVSLYEPTELPFSRWDCSKWALSLNLVAQKAPVDAQENKRLSHGWRQVFILTKRYGNGLRRFMRGRS